MGRFFAYLFTFILGAVIGAAGGAFIGGAGGAYLGACKVIDNAVAAGSMTQDEANASVKSIATDIGIQSADKQRIIDAMKRANQPPSPCQTAIEAL